MLSHARKTHALFGKLADGGLFLLALGAAYFLRVQAAHWLNLAPLEELAVYWWLFPWVAFFGPTMMSSQGLYRQTQFATRLSVVMIVARASLFTVLGTILAMFIVRADFARSVIILVGVFGGFLVLLRHELAQWSRRGERWRQRIFWLGTIEQNDAVRAALKSDEQEAVLTVGSADPTQISPKELSELLHDKSIDVVVTSMEGVDTNKLRPLLTVIRGKGLDLVIRPGVAIGSMGQTTVDDFGGDSVLHVRAREVSPGSLVIKQVIDYLGAGILLLVLSPGMLLIALAIRLTSPGPALFRQTRGGRNGRPFVMWKFRTMRLGAENEQAEMRSANELTGPAFKMNDDPRVTPLGRFLRRHSLDELPQLWNVLRGEMSLVGPRPLPVEEVKAIAAGDDRRRLSVHPGITGLWQVSGRSDIADFAEWVRLDLNYIDHWSIWLDLRILLATIPVALLGKGGR